MTVAFQRMFGILERWNNNQVTPSLSKPHELSYRPKTFSAYIPRFLKHNNVDSRIIKKLPNRKPLGPRYSVDIPFPIRLFNIIDYAHKSNGHVTEL